MVNNRGIYIVKMKLVPMVDWVLSSYIESPYQAWLKLDMKGVLRYEGSTIGVRIRAHCLLFLDILSFLVQ